MDENKDVNQDPIPTSFPKPNVTATPALQQSNSFFSKFKLPIIVTLIILILLVISVVYTYFYYFQSQYIIGPNQNNYPNYETDPLNCKPGHSCVIDEDEGKKKAANKPEVIALAKKYGGWEHVHIKALDIDLVRHKAFIDKIYPNKAVDTGCIIIVHAGDEGFVYREDKNLEVVYEETLPEFIARTKDFDVEYMSKFYLSLH